MKEKRYNHVGKVEERRVKEENMYRGDERKTRLGSYRVNEAWKRHKMINRIGIERSGCRGR